MRDIARHAGSDAENKGDFCGRENSPSHLRFSAFFFEGDSTMYSRQQPTAVLLDPHTLWLDALEALIVRRLGVEVVGKATSTEEALALLEESHADLFVAPLDMLYGELGDLRPLRHARERAPLVNTVVFSSYDDPAVAQAALEAGAVVLLPKTAQADEIALALHRIIEESIDRRYPGAEKPVGLSNGLTRRELEILQLIAEGHTNAEVARMLWVTEQTVKFHLVNVYRKLGVSNRTEAARYAFERGLIRRPVPNAAG
jgi:two-component system response regulator DevR